MQRLVLVVLLCEVCISKRCEALQRTQACARSMMVCRCRTSYITPLTFLPGRGAWHALAEAAEPLGSIL
jgi:hypothetical protein